MAMKEITLTKGKIAHVDEEDYKFLNQYKWYTNKTKKSTDNWYASRHIIINGKRTTIPMHNFLLGMKNIDHIDGNGLNNQRSNLREATHRQNSGNRRKLIIKSSKYKGVAWDKEKKLFKSYTMNNGKLKFLGYFKSEIEAATRYDCEASKNFGNFARLNFPICKGDIKWDSICI